MHRARKCDTEGLCTDRIYSVLFGCVDNMLGHHLKLVSLT